MIVSTPLHRVSLGAALLGAAVSWSAAANAADVTLNGFGDLNYGQRFGAAANAANRATFDTFGEDPSPKNSHAGFGMAGTDFVLTANLTDDWTFLAEVNLQVMRGQSTEFEIDVERMFLERRFNQYFNVQAGLFFTPVGYFNRTLYARAYFMNSVQVPDLWEEELGIVPTHTTGIQVHGQAPLGASHKLGYAASFGNGRSRDPVANTYARDDDGWRSVTLMAEWFFPLGNEARLGASGWFDKVRSVAVRQLGEVRDRLDPTTQEMRLDELGLSGHFVLKSDWVNVILEALYQQHTGDANVIPGGTGQMRVWGGLAEVAANLGEGGAIHPYVRYDFMQLPDFGGPYLSLRGEGTEFTRVYVGDVSMAMGGVAWDVDSGVRLKLEYSHALTGPREQSSIIGQAAFAF